MWTYRAALLDVLDGDTLRLLIDTGYHGRVEEDIRLLDVSAPERNQPGGTEATTFVLDWVYALTKRRWPIQVVTVPNRNPEPDEKRTFTRYLGTITDINDGRNLNADLRGYLAGHPEWGSGI